EGEHVAGPREVQRDYLRLVLPDGQVVIGPHLPHDGPRGLVNGNHRVQLPVTDDEVARGEGGITMVVRRHLTEGIGMRPIAAIPGFGDQLAGVCGKPELVDMLEGEPLPNDFSFRRHLKDGGIAQELWGNMRDLEQDPTRSTW